jgi:hypothetical protein
MNWSRGLFRGWVVVSVLWLATVGAAFAAAWIEAASWDAVAPRVVAETAAERRDRLMGWAALALAPPAALLALGLVGAWVARGFRGGAP